MKLGTEMVAPDSTSANWYPSSRDDGQSYLHDAAAAHALMQAISEQLGSDERGPLLDRADEIMSAWGFES